MLIEFSRNWNQFEAEEEEEEANIRVASLKKNE